MIFENEKLKELKFVKGKPIKGVKIKAIKKVSDERGAIYHMLRNDEDMFSEFGEVYFSLAYPGVVKGWHIHDEMELNYAVVSGMIKLVLFDDRKDSPTKGNILEIFTGDDNYALVKVPKKVWNGFKCISTEKAIVANCATIPHDPKEISRLDPVNNSIPYDWEIKHG